MQVEKLKRWMLDAVADGSWQNFNDLHLDDIDDLAQDRDSWLELGCTSLKLANGLRKELDIKLIVALGVELRSFKDPSEFNLNSKRELQGELGDSPPSLYLFAPDWTNWREMRDRAKLINPELFCNDNPITFYFEYFNVDDLEYRRSIWLYYE